MYLVGSLSVCTLGHVQVGDKVSQRVGLNDGHDANVGVLCISRYEHCTKPEIRSTLTLDLSNNLVDVVLVVRLAVVSNAELSVGGVSSAITVWQIVDDNGHNVIGASSCEVASEERNLSDLVEPDECGDLNNGCSLRLQSRIRNLREGSGNFRSIDGADEILHNHSN